MRRPPADSMRGWIRRASHRARGSAMSTYRAFEVTGARKFELVERQVQEPPLGHVRLRVEACGVCHSDVVAVEGMRPDPSAPVVPGHEIVGGYAESMVARASGLVRIPEGIGSIDAAPLLCAGLTVFSALRQIDHVPGALVAVQGIGGLGHLGVQYANKLGFRVAAIARGTGKAELAAQLGADHYIDSAAEDPGAALQRLGGAAAIIATAASGASMSPLVAGLAPRGRLLVVGAAA